jgi:hypothetical protein
LNNIFDLVLRAFDVDNFDRNGMTGSLVDTARFCQYVASSIESTIAGNLPFEDLAKTTST